MYYRLYASKNNTIFSTVSQDTFTTQEWAKSVNTGDNTVMELMDGRGNSKLLFGFDVPVWLKDKLSTNVFSAKLRLYDAGTLYEPVLPLKETKLQFFSDDFAEGDGWSFLKNSAKNGISNWNYRLDGQPWTSTIFDDVSTYHLNKDNEDLSFDVSSIISSKMALNVANYNFALSLTNHADGNELSAKFIHSRHTRTVFKPYIEFFIDDEIIDCLHNCVAGRSNKLYFINENGTNFSGAVTAKVTLNDGSESTVISTNVGSGVHYISFVPVEPASIVRKEFITVIWAIDGKDVYKQTVTVKGNDMFVKELDYRNLYFYPATPYTHNIVRHGDIIPFNLISEIRGYGNIVLDTYEFRIVSMDGFEMIPWTKANVYRDRMYFNVDTGFFFPELQYEVILRNNARDWVVSSNQTHKFKLISGGQSHLRELNANPYYSRDTPFFK